MLPMEVISKLGKVSKSISRLPSLLMVSFGHLRQVIVVQSTQMKLGNAI
jgi:hypothetical protein